MSDGRMGGREFKASLVVGACLVLFFGSLILGPPQWFYLVLAAVMVPCLCVVGLERRKQERRG